MEILIRKELKEDYPFVFEVVKKAFENVVYSDQSEPYLVQRLRVSEAFIPELSLVAEYKKEIIGHIILSKIEIHNADKKFSSLALAPVSVLPSFQSQGVGSQLIQKAHEIAQAMGFESIVLIGHEGYYPRFGYQPAGQYEISFPFEVPKENAMVIELLKGALDHLKGIVVYPKAFFESDE